MIEIYADFNDVAADETLPLTCLGSVQSLDLVANRIYEGIVVILTDGELRAEASLSKATNGSWYAKSDWVFF
jgi:hypothetical protein